jgi:hypothetical protein
MMKRMWISWPRERLVRAMARSGGVVSKGIGVEDAGCQRTYRLRGW